MAAVQGHASALNNLGVMYEKGSGVTLNKEIAYALCDLVAVSTSDESNAPSH
jgi:TPR repeat protein